MNSSCAGVCVMLVVCCWAGFSGQACRSSEPGAKADFAFRSGAPRYDAAYQKARKVIASDVKDGAFLAGANWAQVWTRDTSYSVELACALLHPDVSKKTLLGLREQVEGIGECWYQDKCGHFAGWPNLTDAIVGAAGAWSLYQVTGDKELLRPIYLRTVNSLKRAERDAFNKELGLFGGCSTFMESNSGYPKKYAMKGPLIAKTHALSTNLLYYRGYLVAARLAAMLGEESQPSGKRPRSWPGHQRPAVAAREGLLCLLPRRRGEAGSPHGRDRRSVGDSLWRGRRGRRPTASSAKRRKPPGAARASGRSIPNGWTTRSSSPCSITTA